ncbi:MAG: NAD-binding protein, partial [Synergistaceae bacterium]|nr:NAD-binding protein [Synergistaceae bacterium]
ISAECDIIFLSLPRNELVRDIVMELFSSCPAGTIILDTSSTSPDIIRALYEAGKKQGVSLLDSPVSGGEPAAIDGTLVFMCGGDKEPFDQALSFLRAMGRSVTYMGGSGTGAVAKIANNMIVGCHLAALGEAFCFAQKAGLDLEVLFQAIRDGFAGSAVMNAKAPRLIARDFSPSARIAVHQKDLKNAATLAKTMNVEIPLSAMVLGYMDQMEAQGRVDEDHCAIARVYEQSMGVTLGEKGTG